MGLHLYCVVPATSTPRESLQGIDGAAVTSFRLGDIACWASDRDQRPEVSVPRIREHNAVIEAALSDDVTPVPVRFGQWVPSPDDLLRRLAGKAAEFQACLILFAGSLEYGIRVLDPSRTPVQAAATGPVATGRDYLAALQQRFHARQPDEAMAELLRQITAGCAGHVRGERVEQEQTSHGMLSVAHLVARGETEAYRACIHRLRESHPQFRFLLSGPWPPYSFATSA